MAAFLSRRCAEGRLSVEELSVRVEAAYGALTYGELEAVARDLPAERGRSTRRRPVLSPAVIASLLLLLGLTAYSLFEALSASPAATLLLLFLLALLAFVVVAAVASLAIAAAPIVALVAGVAYLRRYVAQGRDAIAGPPGRAP